MTPEPFVSAADAARFLSVSRRYLLVLARRGIPGAYAMGTGCTRRVWVFRLSELAAAIEERCPILKGATRGRISEGSLHAETRH
jgi:hypothetical protein